jgi:hypothetical protein
MEDERERIKILAERIKLLFGFCGDLIKDKDLGERVLKLSSSRAEFALSAAPILGAFGLDYEAKNFEAALHAKRAKALLNLLEVLESTENERVEFHEREKRRANGRAELMKTLGL